MFHSLCVLSFLYRTLTKDYLCIFTSRLLIGFVSIFILVLPTVFAKTTSEEVGTVIVGLKTPITVVEEAQAINYMDSGSVELGDAKAKVVSCIEKFSFRKKSIKVDLRCYIVMDDNAPGIMEYVAILIGNEELTKNFDEGKSIFPPRNGLSHWYGHFEFKTSSEKYSWINDQIYLGKGIEMRGPNSPKGGMAQYKLYKLQN